MSLIKPILCAGICILYFTTLTAQALPAKNKTISSLINHHVHQQKVLSIKQILKDSVLYQFETYFFHSDRQLIRSSLSKIYITFIYDSVAPYVRTSEKLRSHLPKNLLYQNKSKYMFRQNLTSLTHIDLWHVFPPLSVSEKLQSHLETSRYTYFETIFTSCWSLNSRKYERPIVSKFFFNYQ